MSVKDNKKKYMYLVGFELYKLNDLILPKNRDVLCVLFNKIRTIKASSKELNCEISEIWNKFSIPIARPQHCINKIENLYEKWLKVQKNSSRKQSKKQKNTEENFVHLLNNLFDIARHDAMKFLNLTQKELLLSSRTLKKSSTVLNDLNTLLTVNDLPGTSSMVEPEEFNNIANQEIKSADSMLPLSQHSSHSFTSVASKRSISDFEDELPQQPVQKKLKLFTPAVISALDRTRTTDRQAWHIIVAISSALGYDAGQVPSHSTIRRHRIEGRKQIANDLKENLQTASSLVVHWDGKMLPDIVDKIKVDRLPILVSSLNTQQLLAVPKLEKSTGINQALIITETLNEWNLTERVKAMCFDTPSVNTGDFNGTCVLLENQLNKKLLHLACRHHIMELVLRSVVECVWPVTKSPNVAIFERFRNKWHTIDKNKFVTGLEDKFVNDVIGSKRTEILQDIRDRLQDEYVRDDHKELLELSYIFLGGIPTQEVKFKAPGANHHARWLAKALYSLKMYMFQTQFYMKSADLNGSRQICLFVIQFYITAWYNAPLAIKAPYNDLTFIQKLISYKKVNKKISNDASLKFSRHLWYLSEELAALTLFDDNVSNEDKRKMAHAILNKESTSENPRRFIAENLNDLLTKNISDFVNKNSVVLFNQFELSYNFLSKDPEAWKSDDDYINCKKILSEMSVDNDNAERGVALIQEYNNSLTKNEEQKQYLLRVVEFQRRKISRCTKNAFSTAYPAT